VRLPGLPGSAEFNRAYEAALAAAPAPVGARRSRPGSLSAAIAEYYGSQAFRSLSGGTPAKRRAILERFRAQLSPDGERTHGELPLNLLPKEFIVRHLDGMLPHTARNWLKTIRHFVKWCLDAKLVRQDPTWGIKIKVPKSDGHHTWTADEITQFEAHHLIGSKPRLAQALGLCTALRREEVVLVGRQHIRDGVLTIRPQKTRNTTGITLTLPVLPELQEILDATPTGHLTLLVTKTGKSYSPNDFSEQFRKWCNDAELPQRCTFHGLRKAALTRLADAGCSVHEIAAVSGHASLKEVERYTKRADQARLARAAMARANEVGSAGVKPEPAPVSKPLQQLDKKAG
jgi:integrase